MGSGILLRSTLSRSVLPTGAEPQLVYVLLDLEAQGVPDTLPKLPLNLGLVIDRSSSMRGERLLQVKEGASRIVDLLGEHDYFSLISFNDRAEVVVAAQRVRNRSELKRKIGAIEAAGGTEMATGLALMLQELQKPMLRQGGVSRMLLLTDGRTYGDEERCLDLTRRAQNRAIGLTALGVGDEWNEDLLQSLADHENSRTEYITSAKVIARVFTDEVKRMASVFAQDVALQIELRPGAVLRSVDRVRPFIAPVALTAEREQCKRAALGDWSGNEPQALLLEVVVPPLTVGDHPLLRLRLRYNLPGAGLSDQQNDMVLRIGIRPAESVPYEVDPTVKHWLERLVAYRLQATAWQQVEQGLIKEATERLQMAGTRLFEAGQINLARTVQEEANRLQRSGQASAEGRKQIKYGTRGLINHNERTV